MPPLSNTTKEPADGFEIPIGEKATDLIVDSLKKLDEQQKLTEQHLSVCPECREEYEALERALKDMDD